MYWRHASLAVFGLAAAGYFAFSSWESRWYLGMIPEDIETGDVVTIGGQSGFREGCGAAVFNLSPRAIEKIKADGIATLTNARQARSHTDSYHSYSNWKQTPHIVTGDGLTLADRWLNGLGCAELPMRQSRDIQQALDSSGSFYATTSEAGLIVIPELGIVIFSYEG